METLTFVYHIGSFVWNKIPAQVLVTTPLGSVFYATDKFSN